MFDRSEYVRIFHEVLGLIDEADIYNANYEDTEEWNSYMHMELIVCLEEKFQIKFSGRDVLKFMSFKDGLVILEEKGIVLKD